MYLSLDDVRKSLPLRLESQHFVLWYAYRYNCPGRGTGKRGVRGQALLTSYIDGLERVYEALAGPVFKRNEPKPDSSERTNVLVFYLPDYLMTGAGCPATVPGRGGVATILLSCRAYEPVMQTALHVATSQAVHEGTHLFNFAARSPGDGRWSWFNEATAVFMEGYLLPGNLESIYHYLDWCDEPEAPLDANRGYQGGMFIHYLMRKFGPDLITRLWEQSRLEETPIQALERLTGSGQDGSTCCSHFADYSLHANFLYDQGSFCFAPDVYHRFGWRMVEEAVRMSGNGKHRVVASVDHLACRYFRVEVRVGLRLLSCHLTTPREYSGIVRGAMAVAKRDLRRGPMEILSQPSPSSGEQLEAAATLKIDDADQIDHVVVVVSNSSTRVDGIPFELEIEGIA